jgi:hypothetical protein
MEYRWQLLARAGSYLMSTTATSSPSTFLPDLLGKFSLPPRADIILRSSDSHDFRVQKLYVIDSSPLLAEQIMAATCHGARLEGEPHSINLLAKGEIRATPCEATTVDGEIKDEPLLPVIQLPESHAMIYSLLTFVFPIIPILPPTIEQILELLSVAEKYEMTTALIRIRDSASRRDPPLICRESALQVYSLARKNGLLKEMLEAAEETLKSPMTSIQNLEEDLNIIPSVALYELWKYRQRVIENLGVSLSTESFRSELCQILSDADQDCDDTSAAGIPLWLDRYFDSVLEDPACVDLTIFHLSLSYHISLLPVSPDRCDRCSTISNETIREFWTALTATVHESARKVSSTSLNVNMTDLSTSTG